MSDTLGFPRETSRVTLAGVCVIVYLISRGLVMLSARLVERRIRRKRGDGGGDDGRGGRGGGAELVLAA